MPVERTEVAVAVNDMGPSVSVQPFSSAICIWRPACHGVCASVPNVTTGHNCKWQDVTADPKFWGLQLQVPPNGSAKMGTSRQGITRNESVTDEMCERIINLPKSIWMCATSWPQAYRHHAGENAYHGNQLEGSVKPHFSNLPLRHLLNLEEINKWNNNH